MEDIDSAGVFQELGGFPGWGVVTFPEDQVLRAVTMSAAVQNLLDFVLVFAVDFHRGRRWKYLSREGVIAGGVEERDVEHRVTLHCVWELEFIGMGADDSSGCKGAEAAGVQLATWSGGTEVPGIEPDLIAYVEVGGGYSVAVGGFLLSGLRIAHFGADNIVDIGQDFGGGLGVSFYRHAHPKLASTPATLQSKTERRK